MIGTPAPWPPDQFGAPLTFRLLGQFRAEAHGRLVVFRRRQERQLLTALLLDCGRSVPVDRLVGLLWADAVPDNARRLVGAHVSRIRSTLVKARAGGELLTILSGPSGYTACCEESAVDTVRFRALVARGTAAADPRERILLLRQALSMWQAPILGDFVDQYARAVLCLPLDELRLAAAEALLTAELSQGAHHRVLAEVGPLLAEHPYHERLVGLKMVALHRSGRRAEALEAYRAYRTTVTHEIGLEPGVALRDLHGQLLDDRIAQAFDEVPWSRPSTPSRSG